MSTSVAYHLPVKIIYFGGPQGWKSLGPTLPAGCVIGYIRVGSYRPTSLQSTVLCPVIFITFDPLLAQSKLSPGIRHLTPTASVSGYKPWVQVCQISAVPMWRSGMYHLLQCAMYKPRAAEGTWHQSMSPYTLYFFVFLYLCYGMLHLICHRWTCRM